jgi:hypothetical protein
MRLGRQQGYAAARTHSAPTAVGIHWSPLPHGGKPQTRKGAPQGGRNRPNRARSPASGAWPARWVLVVSVCAGFPCCACIESSGRANHVRTGMKLLIAWVVVW